MEAISVQLESATRCLSRRLGTTVTQTLGYIQAAQANLLRLAPLPFVRGSLPSLVMQARRGLDEGDMRLIWLHDVVRRAAAADLTENDRYVIVSCVSGANEEIRRQQLRLQSFRNVIVVTAGFLLLLVIVVAISSFLRPELLPLCFVTDVAGQVVVSCPSGQSIAPQPGLGPDTNYNIADLVRGNVHPFDILLIEFLGFLGAALSAAISIKDVRGSADPYSIPVALSFLKLPTGALTAFLGIIFIRAELVPGIETFDSSAEIIAWALVLGFSQQLFTGVVDRQAKAVLEQSGAALPAPRGVTASS